MCAFRRIITINRARAIVDQMAGLYSSPQQSQSEKRLSERTKNELFNNPMAMRELLKILVEMYFGKPERK